MNFLRPQLSYVAQRCQDDISTFERVKRGCNFQVSLLILGYIILFIVVDLAILFGPTYVAVADSNGDSVINIPTLTITSQQEELQSQLNRNPYAQFASVPPVNSPMFYQSLSRQSVDPVTDNNIANIFRTAGKTTTLPAATLRGAQQFLNQPQAIMHLCSTELGTQQSCARLNAVAFDRASTRFVPASTCKSYCLRTSLVTQPGFNGLCQC